MSPSSPKHRATSRSGSGSTAAGKSTDHIASSDTCEDCHFSGDWLTVAVDHAVVTGTCVSCHDGATATGKSSDHIASGKGSLLELLFLLDSLEARNQDTKGFGRAKKEYASHARAVAWLEKGGLTSVASIQAKSQQAAALISATISALAIIALSLIYVT